MIKISIIIPVYNDEKYLGECLNSVTKQTLKDIEIICINDGSTDRTLEIMQQFANIHSNILILSQKNVGVGNARNIGLQVAGGEFIAFMDGDDYYPTDDVLESLYQRAIENDVQICGGSYSQDRNGIIFENFSGILTLQKFKWNNFIDFSEYAFPLGFTRFIYSREMLNTFMVRFPDYVIFEDPLFLVRAMACTEKIYGISKSVYRHRVSIHQRDWISLRVVELLKSTTEILQIASHKGWIQLQLNLMIYLYDSYYSYISKYIYINNQNVLKELEDLNNAFMPELIQHNSELLKKFSVDGMQNYLLELEHTISNFNNLVKKYNKIILYGAGEGGRTIKKYLSKNLNTQVFKFAVTSLEGNTQSLDDIEVECIDSLLKFKDEALFIIAVTPKFRYEIEELLEQLDIQNIYYIDYKILQIFYS